MVDVAQLVESQVVILVVAGSSPVGHPTSLLRRCGYNARPLLREAAAVQWVASSMVEQLTLNQ